MRCLYTICPNLQHYSPVEKISSTNIQFYELRPYQSILYVPIISHTYTTEKSRNMRVSPHVDCVGGTGGLGPHF